MFGAVATSCGFSIRAATHGTLMSMAVVAMRHTIITASGFETGYTIISGKSCLCHESSYDQR